MVKDKRKNEERTSKGGKGEGEKQVWRSDGEDGEQGRRW